MKKFLLSGVALTVLANGGLAIAADLPVKATPLPPVVWSWQGFYGGIETGAAWGTTNFSDPFGASIYGDNVRTPGYFLGADIGFNWQMGQWVYGLEATGDWLKSDGTNTCAAFSGFYVSSNCGASPKAFATATARVGHTFGPADRTLVYVKGGFAWMRTDLMSTTNNLFFGVFPQPPSNVLSASSGGWTVGVGVERSLTPAWSVKFEYDYMNFQNLGTIGISQSVFFNPAGAGFLAAVPATTSSVKENLQIFKIGLNYHFGQDPWAPGWGAAAAMPSYPVKAAPIATAWASGWEFDFGSRIWFSSGRFQWDNAQGINTPNIQESRLTYSGLSGVSGEYFQRIDSPWGIFVKGNVGVGRINNGKQNDEDWGVLGFVAYSNTLSNEGNGRLSYGTLDAGYDVLRGPGYKVGPFVGYNVFNQRTDTTGCVQIANPAFPCLAPGDNRLVGTQDTRWESLRVGMSAETMLFDRVKISGDVAYLPWVGFTGRDNHLLRNQTTFFDQIANAGHGVQAEAILSYLVTSNWTVGVGARYWAMWTTDGTFTCTGCGAPGVTGAADAARYSTERYGVFLETSYKFDVPSAVVAKY
jgi:opacity protein-like surface antigen